MYVNGELQDFPTLKEFTKDKFIGGNLYEYYKEFFERLETVDFIIDTLFKEGFYRINFVTFDLDSSSTDKEMYIEKIKMIASTVYYRMQREHKVYVDIHITDRMLEPIHIEYRLLLDPKNDPRYNKELQYWKQQCPDRATGRTTRNVNQYIQFAYQQWLRNEKQGIDIIDHFSYEMHMYDRHFLGRSIAGPNNANQHCFNKLRQRIEEEFPESILNFVQCGNYKLSYNLPHMKNIDYNGLE